MSALRDTSLYHSASVRAFADASQPALASMR